MSYNIFKINMRDEEKRVDFYSFVYNELQKNPLNVPEEDQQKINDEVFAIINKVEFVIPESAPETYPFNIHAKSLIKATCNHYKEKDEDINYTYYGPQIMEFMSNLIDKYKLTDPDCISEIEQKGKKETLRVMFNDIIEVRAESEKIIGENGMSKSFVLGARSLLLAARDNVMEMDVKISQDNCLSTVRNAKVEKDDGSEISTLLAVPQVREIMIDASNEAFRRFKSLSPKNIIWFINIVNI